MSAAVCEEDPWKKYEKQATLARLLQGTFVMKQEGLLRNPKEMLGEKRKRKQQQLSKGVGGRTKEDAITIGGGAGKNDDEDDDDDDDDDDENNGNISVSKWNKYWEAFTEEINNYDEQLMTSSSLEEGSEADEQQQAVEVEEQQYFKNLDSMLNLSSKSIINRQTTKYADGVQFVVQIPVPPQLQEDDSSFLRKFPHHYKVKLLEIASRCGVVIWFDAQMSEERRQKKGAFVNCQVTIFFTAVLSASMFASILENMRFLHEPMKIPGVHQETAHHHRPPFFIGSGAIERLNSNRNFSKNMEGGGGVGGKKPPEEQENSSSSMEGPILVFGKGKLGLPNEKQHPLFPFVEVLFVDVFGATKVVYHNRCFFIYFKKVSEAKRVLHLLHHSFASIFRQALTFAVKPSCQQLQPFEEISVLKQ